jgi:hypothetical protein
MAASAPETSAPLLVKVSFPASSNDLPEFAKPLFDAFFREVTSLQNTRPEKVQNSTLVFDLEDREGAVKLFYKWDSQSELLQIGSFPSRYSDPHWACSFSRAPGQAGITQDSAPNFAYLALKKDEHPTPTLENLRECLRGCPKLMGSLASWTLPVKNTLGHQLYNFTLELSFAEESPPASTLSALFVNPDSASEPTQDPQAQSASQPTLINLQAQIDELKDLFRKSFA